MRKKGADAKFLMRRLILEQLEAASPAWLSFETMLVGLECAGLKCGKEVLVSETDYLCQKGLVEVSCSHISAAHLRAKITAKGRDYLEGGED